MRHHNIDTVWPLQTHTSQSLDCSWCDQITLPLKLLKLWLMLCTAMATVGIHTIEICH